MIVDLDHLKSELECSREKKKRELIALQEVLRSVDRVQQIALERSGPEAATAPDKPRQDERTNPVLDLTDWRHSVKS